MITDEELDHIPSDPDEAVCFLVEALREKVRDYLDRSERHDWEIEREYVNLLRGFLLEYDVGINDFFKSEPPIDDSEFHHYYRTFNVLFDQYVASVRIRRAMSRKRDRLPLDVKTRAKIHHHIQRIRDILHKLDIPVEKKDQILERLNKFSSAVDKERTDIKIILDVALEAADTGGEVAKKLSGVRKHIEAMTGLLAEAREWTDRILGWPKPKQIEAPRKKLPPPERTPQESSCDDLDDEIPF